MSRTKRVLVDHGSADNLGDTSMLEGAVYELLAADDRVETHVVHRPGLRTAIWNWPRVRQVNLTTYRWSPNLARNLSRLPYFWRYADAVQTLRQQPAWALLGKRWGAGRYGHVDCERVNLREWCSQFDGLHIVGGGNLTDTFPSELWQRCALINAFASTRKPIVLTGQQIGPFRWAAMRRACERAARRASFIGLREPGASTAFLRSAGVREGRYAVMGDDSFGLIPCPASEIRELLAAEGVQSGRFIAFNYRVASYSGNTERFLGPVTSLLRHLLVQYDLPILAVPIARNSGDSDVKAAHLIADAVGSPNFRVMEGEKLTPAQVKGLLGQAHAAIGVSYHFCTFALSQGVPAVCLYDGGYYRQKALGICDYWHCPDLAVECAALAQKDTMGRIARVFDDGNLRDRLRARAVAATEQWRECFRTHVAEALALGPCARI